MAKKIKRKFFLFITALLLAVSLATSYLPAEPDMVGTEVSQAALPSYSGSPYKTINQNIPGFSDEEKENTEAFETYSSLDELGRCGVAYANICKEIMPTEKRESISEVHPSGWHSNMGWERCHLIGFQLAGENANEQNLITGTHYFNVTGMLPFENMVDDYVDETGNHVLYRVTPCFEGDNLIASGVQMEAWSVEDGGDGICFNVYVFNVQPDSVIDYETGIIK
jgi:DNA-entry nuclease